MAYRTWGAPSKEAVLVCHALTGSADADDWWGGLFGTGRTFDPSRDYVVAMNCLGSCYGTTGPTDAPPGSTVPYGPDFPSISIEDTVRLQALALEQLGVERLSLVIGGSMGGMQALQWGVTFPDRVDSLVPIGTGSAQSGWAVAISDAQRAAIHTDPKFRGGSYPADDPPAAGLATARMMAMISYRSYTEFEERFARERNGGVFAAQEYLRRHGERLVERFDANTYLTLIGAMDSFDITDRVGSITTPTLLVGISSDILYPPHEVEQVAAAMPNARFVLLSADQGHDSFLIDTDQLDHIVRWFRRSASRSPHHGNRAARKGEPAVAATHRCPMTLI